MFTLLSALSLLFESGVLAANQTRYEKIRGLFVSADPVTIEEVSETALIGRCFTNKNPDKAMGSMLGTAEITDTAGGPLFPQTRIGWAFQVGIHKQDRHFDDWTYSDAYFYVRPLSADALLEEIKEGLGPPTGKTDFALIEEIKTALYYRRAFWNAVAGSGWATYRSEDWFWLRKKDGYHVLYAEYKDYLDAAGKVLNPRHPPWNLSCYYFKQLAKAP